MKYTQEELNSVNLRAGRFDMTQIPRLRTDFTEADGMSLRDETDDGFESDMGAS